MSIPLRILLVEDSSSDAELILAELGLAGFAPQCVRVDSELEFVTQLNSEWDIIITDYNLPQFDGLRVLEHWRTRDLTVPVIVVTGRVGEEVAVECVRQGATDYLLKDRLTRLGPAVKRALEERQLRDEKRQAAEALRQHNEYLAALHETSVGLINRLELNPLLDSIVARAAALAGTPHGYIDLIAPDGSVLIQQVGCGVFTLSGVDKVKYGEGIGGRVWQTGQPLAVNNYRDWPGRLKQWESKPFHAAVGLPLRSGGKVVGVIGLAYAEPERVFTPEQVELLSHFAELASIALDNARLFSAAQAEIAERKRVESVIQHERDFAIQVMSTLGQGVTVTRTDGVLEYVDPAYARMIGYSPEELIGKNSTEVAVEDDVDLLLYQRERRRSGEASSYEIRLRHKDGRVVPVLITGTPRSADGRVDGAITVVTDLTERKRSEAVRDAIYLIAQATTHTRSLDDLFPAVHNIIKTIMPADNFYIALYDDLDDLLSFPYFVDEIDKPAPPQKPGRGLTEYVLRTGASLLCDAEMDLALQRAGETDLVGESMAVWLGVPLVVEQKTIGVMAVQDYKSLSYTQREQQLLEFVSSEIAGAINRKRAEEALRKSEERFRVLAENIPGVIFQCKNDDRYTFIYLNDAIEELTGYPKEDFLGNGLSFFDLFHPDDRAWIPIPSERPEANWRPYRVVYRIRHKSGNWRWVEEWGTAVHIVEGQPRILEGFMADITERQRSEELLSRNARELAALDHMGKVVAGSLDLAEVLKKVIDEVSPLLQAEGISILLPEGQDRLVFAAASGPASAGLSGHRIPMMASAAGGVMKSGQTVLIVSGEGEPQLYREIEAVQQFLTRSLLVVPLVLGGKVIGVMEAVHTQPNAFTPGDQRLLEAAATWAAIAIGNARQHEYTQRRLQESEAMAAISQALNKTLQLPIILQLIVDSARKIIPTASRAVIDLYDEARNVLIPVAASGGRRLGEDEIIMRPGEGITGRVFLEGSLINVGNTSNMPGFIPGPPDHPLLSLLSVPVESGLRRLGTLNLDSPEPSAFSADDERLLTNLGVQAALAIENARLYQAVSRRANELNTVSDILRTLNAAPNVAEAFPSLAEGLKSISGCERVSMGLYDDHYQTYTVIALDKNRPEVQVGTRLVVNRAFSVTQDILSGRVHLTPDLTAETESPGVKDLIQAGVRSRANFPLRPGGGRVIGSINLNWTTLNGYSLAQLPLLEQIADAIALALEKNRLLVETTEALNREQRLNELARAISGSLDLSSALNVVTRIAAELVSADAASLAMVSPDGNTISSVHLYNFPQFFAGVPIPRGQGLAWQIFDSRKPMLLADYSAHPNALPEWVEAGVRAFLGVPIIVGQLCLGVLGLFRLNLEKPFGPRDIALAEGVGRQAGVAIQSTQLFEALNKRASELAAVAQVSIDTATVLDPQELLLKVVNLTKISFNLYHAHIYLLSPAEDSLLLAVWAGDAGREQAAAQDRIPLTQERSLVAQAARIRQPIVVNDTTQEPLFLPNPALPNIRSELVVPLVVSDKLLGVLDVQADSMNRFTEEDVRIQSILAAQVAVALQTAQLFEALSRETRRIELLYTVSQSVTMTLDPREVASRAVQLTTTALGADIGEVFQVQQGTDRLHLLAATGYTAEPTEELSARVDLRIGKGLSGQAALTKKPIVASNVAENPYWAFVPGLDDDIESAASLPLLVGDELLGVFTLLSKQRAFFGDEQLPTLTAVVASVALALKNAQLFDAELQQVEALTALHETALELSTELDLTALLHSIVERATRLLEAPMGGLSLLQPDGETLELVVNHNISAKYLGTRIKLGEGATGIAAQTGVPLIVDDYPNWPHRAAVYTDASFRSIVAVPIKWRGQVIGIISANSDAPNLFVQADAEMVSLFADQAAVAIANARQHSELQRRLKESDAVSTISRALNQTLELGKVLTLIVESARQVIPNVDRAVIHLLDRDQQTLRPAAVSGEGESGQSVIMRPGEGVAGQVIARGVVINVADTHNDPRYLMPGRASPTRSLLVAPVQSGTHLMGTLSVNSVISNAFSADDERLIATLGAQAALAIYNAQLFEDTRRQLDELLLLHTVAVASTEATSEDELITRTTKLIGNTFYPVDFGIMLIDETGSYLRAHDSYRAGPPGFQVRLGEGITGQVAATGQPWLVPDVNREFAYVKLHETTRSELCVPLKAGNTILGVVDAASTEVNGFTEKDERLLVTLAGQLATAIQRLRYFRDLEQALRQEKAARTQLVQSEKLAAMGRLVASVAHELNNPLQAIQNALYLVKQEPALSSQAFDDLKVASTEADRMADLIYRLRETYRPATSEEFRFESLNTIVTDVQKLIATHLRHNNIEFKFEPDQNLPLVPGIRDQLKQVMLNLCLNAVEAMSSGGTLTVRTRHEPLKSSVLLIIQDTGMGITADILSNVFDPFFTTKETGTGLGLTITYDIIQRHKGQIEVTSEPNQGTQFSIWLPIEVAETDP